MDSRTKGNIAVGAIISFVFAPYTEGRLIGGAVAGYLEGVDLQLGTRVGAIAGIVVFIASILLVVRNTLLGIEPRGIRDILSRSHRVRGSVCLDAV